MSCGAAEQGRMRLTKRTPLRSRCPVLGALTEVGAMWLDALVIDLLRPDTAGAHPSTRY